MDRIKCSIRRGVAGLSKTVNDFEWLSIAIYVYLVAAFFDALYFRQIIDLTTFWFFVPCVFVVVTMVLKKNSFLLVSAFGWAFFLYAFVVRRLAPMIHGLSDNIGVIFARLLTLLGFATQSNPPFIDILTGSGWLRISASAELLSLWHVIVISWLVFILAGRKNPLQYFVRLMVGVGIVIPALGIASVWFVRDFSDLGFLGNPAIVRFKLLIFSFFLAYGLKTESVRDWRALIRPKALLFAVGVLCICLASVLVPMHGARPIRVLIDNTHGDWEPTNRPMETEHFGQKFTYTYSELVRLLCMYGELTELDRGPITDHVLGDHNIVILKTPSIPFSSAEIKALEQYVLTGGGLLVLGDHTNLIGMSTILNQVLEPYKVRFDYDDTFDPRTGGFVEWRPRLVDLTPLIGKVPKMKFETGCSVYSNAFQSWDLMTIREAASESLRWENPGFFGNIKLDSWENYGNFSACVLAPYGRGRVIAFGDSTVLSNFSIFFPGRREMLLSWIGLLSSTPNSHFSRITLGILGVGLIGLSFWAFRDGKELSPPSLGILLGLSAILCIIVLNGYYFSRPSLEPTVDLPNIAFVGNYNLRSGGGTSLREYAPDFPNDYSTFFMASQRVGFMPIWYNDAYFDSSSMGAIFVNPAVLDDEKFLNVAREFAESGKNVLVLRSLYETETQMEIVDKILGETAKHSLGPVENSSVWAVNGKGQVIIYDNREQLARALIGKATDIPETEEDFERYEIAFKLLEAVGRAK